MSLVCDDPAEAKALALLALDDRQCHYPTTAVGYCGQAVVGRTVYCAHHFKLVHGSHRVPRALAPPARLPARIAAPMRDDEAEAEAAVHRPGLRPPRTKRAEAPALLPRRHAVDVIAETAAQAQAGLARRQAYRKGLAGTVALVPIASESETDVGVPVQGLSNSGLPIRVRPEAAATTLRSIPDVSVRLDPRLTLAHFRRGDSNALAFAEVAKIAAGMSLCAKPLMLFGASGTGKTHLVQALAATLAAKGLACRYLTAERFVHGFDHRHPAEVLRAFEDCDCLILDDLQALTGVTVCHTLWLILSALFARGVPVVLTMGQPLRELDHIDAQLRARLAGGLAIPMTWPDAALRASILAKEIHLLQSALPDFEVAPDVLRQVAAWLSGSGRVMGAAALRLLAQSSLLGRRLSCEETRAALGDLLAQSEAKPAPSIVDIQTVVAAHFAVTRHDILSARRTQPLVRARQIAMYLAKTLTLKSLPEIGRRFGGRDHTTVLHAVRRIDRLLEQGEHIEDVRQCRGLIEAGVKA